jgi:hypothetical protein
LNKEIDCNFAKAHALIAQQMHTELQLIEEIIVRALRYVRLFDDFKTKRLISAA